MINSQQTQIPFVINQPGIEVRQPIGLSDYYGIIMNLLGADGPYRNLPLAETGKGVFLYIGQLDKPNLIGLIEEGGRWTVLDVYKQLVSFKDLDRTLSYSDLGNHFLLKARLDRLILAWERQRWEKQLVRRASRALK